MLACTAEGKQPCSPRVSALTALSPKTPVAARESAIQDLFQGLEQSAVAEDTAQNTMADHMMVRGLPRRARRESANLMAPSQMM